MTIESIIIERQANGCQCGTLVVREGGEPAHVLWMLQWRRGQQVVAEFVPGEGATQDLIRAHHARLVEATTKDVFDRVSRKALFS
ncbi:hypothetical protein D3C72_576110 [compost metagenome]